MLNEVKHLNDSLAMLAWENDNIVPVAGIRRKLRCDHSQRYHIFFCFRLLRSWSAINEKRIN